MKLSAPVIGSPQQELSQAVAELRSAAELIRTAIVGGPVPSISSVGMELCADLYARAGRLESFARNWVVIAETSAALLRGICIGEKPSPEPDPGATDLTFTIPAAPTHVHTGASVSERASLLQRAADGIDSSAALLDEIGRKQHWGPMSDRTRLGEMSERIRGLAAEMVNREN